uniref:Isopenicillin N synthase-like Fe(2+) 2OG dioxygenase domain-containing protein n=1 Tax=Kalanchoe fedtschenkoi TaxID=63787 RepID=A0A7N0UWQ0_KALFE
MLGLARGFFDQPLEEKMKFCSNGAPEWLWDPTSFSSLVTYRNKVNQLGLFLEELISESLGFDKKYISNVLGVQGQRSCMNYYPKTLAPELLYGLPVHTDPNVLTIFLHNHSAPELHIFKDDKWLKFNPRPDSLVICIGDRLQALSGGRYKNPVS